MRCSAYRAHQYFLVVVAYTCRAPWVIYTCSLTGTPCIPIFVYEQVHSVSLVTPVLRRAAAIKVYAQVDGCPFEGGCGAYTRPVWRLASLKQFPVYAQQQGRGNTRLCGRPGVTRAFQANKVCCVPQWSGDNCATNPYRHAYLSVDVGLVTSAIKVEVLAGTVSGRGDACLL